MRNAAVLGSARARRFMTVTLTLALLSACASAPRPSATSGVTDSGRGVDLADAAHTRQALYAQYEQWADTPYRYGGLGSNGIDCSGFVYRTFDSQFGLLLPRTTGAQIQLGRPVGRDDLQAGDLVFFKTHWKTLHVGIFIEQARFVHASTSSGVIISDLRNPYWAGHYLQARRLRGTRQRSRTGLHTQLRARASAADPAQRIVR